MKKLYYRIVNAIKMGWWALCNPVLYDETVLKMIEGLYGLIFKTVKEQRPMATKIGVINLDTGEKQDIVTLWCGCGMASDPLNRIQELLLENETLKRENSRLLRERDEQNGTLLTA